MNLFDAHTHIQFSAYDEDRDEVMKRAIDAGVKMVLVGTQRDTSTAGVALAEKHVGHAWAAVGLHPIHTEKSYHDVQELGGGEAAQAFTSRGEEFDFDYYKELAQKDSVVAIGECGLDYYRLSEEGKERQIAVFKSQIQLAEEVGKALMIHCRPSKGTDNAYEDLLSIVSSFKLSVPLIIHFYVGSLEMTKKLLNAGRVYFTFGGVITFAKDYEEIIKYIPLEHILLETDAPYVSPVPYRGKRNEPAYIIETAKKLAEIKEIAYDTVVQTIEASAKKAFKI